MDKLPRELIEKVALNLDLRSLGRFVSTSSSNNTTFKSKIFWKSYYALYYPCWLPTGRNCDLLTDCRTMLLAWVDTGLNFTTKRTDVLSTIYFPYKSFAYDGNNRFGVLGGYGVPLMSFSVTEDLKFVTLDKYDLPESRHKTPVPMQICLDDRFIVVGESSGSIIVCNKKTGEIFSQFEDSTVDPIVELYFDREKVFYSKWNGSIRLLDFETGQKINQHTTNLGVDMVCTYDSKSNLCFYSELLPDKVSMIDFRMSPTKVCRTWKVPTNVTYSWKMKYFNNELYCGTDAGPLVFDLLYGMTKSYHYEYRNELDRRVITMHVDADRVLLGTQKHFFVFDKRDRAQSCSINVSEKRDVQHYSFQDSYYIVNQTDSTSLYSVCDLSRFGNDLPDELIGKALGLGIVTSK